jgi:hypothetical protein
MRSPALTRFRLLLVQDIAWFTFFFACAIPSRRMAYIIGGSLVLLAKHAGARAERLTERLTGRQMRVRAAITIAGCAGLTVGAIYAIGLSNPRIWVFFGIGFPVLAVFCYVQVRLELGLEPNMQGNEPQASNHGMQPRKRFGADLGSS